MISVIVPVYNVEKYLKDCIESILKQTFSNFELILLDDGSTDKSGMICDQYIKDSRVKVIHKKNEGVSATRNRGIEEANGEFITFIDSDDCIDENMLEIMLEYQKKDNADLVQCNLINFTDDKCFFPYKNVKTHLYNSDDEELKRSIISINYSNINCNGKYGPIRCIGGKLYRTSIIKNNNIKFDEKIYILEDGIFNFEFYEKATTVMILSDALYKYRQIPSSTTYRYNKDQLEQNKLISNYFKDKNIDEKYTLVNYLNCFELLSTYLNREYKYKKMSMSNYKKTLKEILKQELYKETISNLQYSDLNFRENIKLFCLKNNFYILLYIFTFLRNIKTK